MSVGWRDESLGSLTPDVKLQANHINAETYVVPDREARMRRAYEPSSVPAVAGRKSLCNARRHAELLFSACPSCPTS